MLWGDNLCTRAFFNGHPVVKGWHRKKESLRRRETARSWFQGPPQVTIYNFMKLQPYMNASYDVNVVYKGEWLLWANIVSYEVINAWWSYLLFINVGASLHVRWITTKKGRRRRSTKKLAVVYEAEKNEREERDVKQSMGEKLLLRL